MHSGETKLSCVRTRRVVCSLSLACVGPQHAIAQRSASKPAPHCGAALGDFLDSDNSSSPLTWLLPATHCAAPGLQGLAQPPQGARAVALGRHDGEVRWLHLLRHRPADVPQPRAPAEPLPRRRRERLRPHHPRGQGAAAPPSPAAPATSGRTSSLLNRRRIVTHLLVTSLAPSPPPSRPQFITAATFKAALKAHASSLQSVNLSGKKLGVQTIGDIGRGPGKTLLHLTLGGGANKARPCGRAALALRSVEQSLLGEGPPPFVSCRRDGTTSDVRLSPPGPPPRSSARRTSSTSSPPARSSAPSPWPSASPRTPT